METEVAESGPSAAVRRPDDRRVQQAPASGRWCGGADIHAAAGSDYRRRRRDSGHGVAVGCTRGGCTRGA